MDRGRRPRLLSLGLAPDRDAIVKALVIGVVQIGEQFPEITFEERGTGTADQSLAVAVDGIVVAELASLTAADIPDLTIDAQWNTVAFGA